METTAKMSSKGQITVPKASGTIKVPAARRKAAWDEVMKKTRVTRSRLADEGTRRHERPGQASHG